MTEVRTAPITRDIIENAYSYDEYRELIDTLLKQGKTSGENHSEAMLHYTKMNVHRMKRLDKQTGLSDEIRTRLEKIERPMIWLILTEAWCGDAAQSIPIIQKMADVSKKVQTRYIFRDQNLKIMDQFLTNGRSRSVPKIVVLDMKTLEVLGSWGPRPDTAQNLYDELRNRSDIPKQTAAESLHKWYADDNTESMQKEFLSLIDLWEKA
jgi:hypothetical protein